MLPLTAVIDLQETVASPAQMRRGAIFRSPAGMNTGRPTPAAGVAWSGRLLCGINSRLYLMLALQEAQVAAWMPVSLAAPGALLLRAGLVGPAVFFLPHPLGEDAQGEVTRWGPAAFAIRAPR